MNDLNRQLTLHGRSSFKVTEVYSEPSHQRWSLCIIMAGLNTPLDYYCKLDKGEGYADALI